MGKERIRSYEVRFAVYTDVPPPPEVQAEREAANSTPPPPPDTLLVPASEWTEDVEGTAVTRQR